MANLKLYTGNTNSVQLGTNMVVAGKSGATYDIGVSELIYTGFSTGIDTITLAVNNLHLVYNDVLSSEATSQLSNVFVQLPIQQLADLPYEEGSTGYFKTDTYATFEVRSVNVQTNSITVWDSIYSNTRLSYKVLSAPYRIKLFQPKLLSDNVVYVSGTRKQFYSYANSSNSAGNYIVELKRPPSLESDISVYLDDISTTAYTWPVNNNYNQVSVAVSSATNNITVLVNSYLPPSLEANDIVSLSFFDNTFRVLSTSYCEGDSYYNIDFNRSGIYKVQLNKPLPFMATGNKLVNITPDITANVLSKDSNSFTLELPDNYPYTYKLANTGIYYAYKQSSARFSTAKLDEYGRINNITPGTYIIKATNINRFNRVSPVVQKTVTIPNLKLAKVSSIEVDEYVLIDTLGGATISATIKFPPIQARDIQNYEIKYRVLSNESSVVPEYSTIFVSHNESSDYIRATVNNLNRGRYSGSNTLDIIVTPLNGTYRGYSVTYTHSLIGKTAKPSPLNNLNIAQQGNNVLFTWQFQLTSDGYIQDLDTKEVEIREFFGAIDISDQSTLNATWGISLPITRIPFPNTLYSLSVSKYGIYTYLLRVRDTSNIESETIVAATLEIKRPDYVRLYKAYNESNAAIAFAAQDGVTFNNANTHPEPAFPSVSDSITNGFVTALSSNTDNSNGSSVGLTFYSDTEYLTTGTSERAVYTTAIRDMGQSIRGTIRINPIISISSPNFTYASQYDVKFTGISDYQAVEGLPVSANILVDNTIGIGHILGFNNSNAASVTYNTFHKTLTSGGPYGNVYAIRNPGQFTGDGANANSFALIAGVVNANAIVLGEVYFANGFTTGSNVFSNLAISGNAYELVDLYQFIDPRGTVTFLGPESSVVENVFIRFSNSNVFYDASSNGVVGFPNHGNTNAFAFYGATSNSELGFKNYIAGELDFRYFQVSVELINKLPSQTSILLEKLYYEVDIAEKTFRTNKQVNSASGIYIDYSTTGYIQSPNINATVINTNGGYTVSVYDITNIGCNVKVFSLATGLAVATENVSVIAQGI